MSEPASSSESWLQHAGKPAEVPARRHLRPLEKVSPDPDVPQFTRSQAVVIDDQEIWVNVALSNEEALLVAAVRERLIVTGRLNPGHLLAAIHGTDQYSVYNQGSDGQRDPTAAPVTINQAYIASRAGEILRQYGVQVDQNDHPT